MKECTFDIFDKQTYSKGTSIIKRTKKINVEIQEQTASLMKKS